MNRWVVAGYLVAFLTIVGAIGSVGAVAHDDATAGSVGAIERNEPSVSAAVYQGDEMEFDRTFFQITVHENGSATWTFRYERTLETNANGNDIEAFEAFAAEFESEETDLYDRFTRQASGLTDTGAERTDREMEATEFNRSAEVEHGFRDVGVVEMSFLWKGFAEVDENEVVVGDVFDRMYLNEDQRLVIEAGDDLTFVRTHPEGQYAGSLESANSVTWLGEREFIPGEPRAELEREGDTTDDESFVSIDPPLFAVATLLVVSLVIAGAFAWRRASTRPAEAIGSLVTADDDPDHDSTASDAQPIAEDELLTDEDRVVELIRENGGRMKQIDIVEETGWSKSKVSMLLSEMESEGTISKLRVGRENIISLDGFEPEATKSPLDE